MMLKLVVGVLALSVASANAAAVPSGGPASLMIEFDNRGSKVMKEGTADKILSVLAKNVFNVPVSQVFQVSGEGRSNLVNHKSTVTYAAQGPTLNGKSVYDNCVANTKKGWFSSSTVAKEIKKVTDTWWPGDSVSVKKTTCAEFKLTGMTNKSSKSGRKLMTA